MTGAVNNPCRLCGGTGRRVFLGEVITGHHDRFALSQCDNCTLVSTTPAPSEQLLKQYYDQDYWHCSPVNHHRPLENLYRLRMKPIVSAIRRYTAHDSKILDWGCGDGSFIRLLRKFDLDCFGIDAYKQDLNDPRVKATSIENADFPDGYFDIITCFHVLEHVTDPLISVCHALRLLKTGGVIIVEVPNLDSVGFQIFKHRWQPLEIPTHLNHFTPATLQRVFETAGNVKILKTEFFSHRISPAALVLSLFPALSPRNTRKKYKGRYPLPRLGVYFLMQLLSYPLAAAGSLLGRGEIVRMFFWKTG